MKAVNNVLMSYIKLCYVYVKSKRTNQSCSSSIISQSTNVEWPTCDRNGKNTLSKTGSMSESKKNFGCLINLGFF